MHQRLAALAAALCAAAAVQAQDAAPAAKGPTTIDAEKIEGVSDLEVTARGSVELKRDDLTIFSEFLKYNQELGRVEAEGGVRLQRGNDRFFGPRLRYNTTDDTGEFEEPTYLLQREQTARGRASRIEFLGQDRMRLRDATFTTCEPGRDDWVLLVEELELDYPAEEGRARQPRLRFLDTTIAALPFATFPLEKRRKSGFLTPYYSQTTSRGLELGVPYYWNIAPEQDATLTPVYMTKRGTQLKTAYRYLDPKYAGELKLELLPDDKEFKRTRHGLSLQHSHRFGPSASAQLDFNRVSDDRYFVDLGSQVRQVSVGNLNRDAIFNYSGAIGDQGYSLQARIQRFQTLQDPLAPIVSPYHRVPQLSFGATRNDIAGLFDAGLPAELVRFSHPTLIQGTRVTLNPTLSAPLLAPGWFLTPKLGLRYARYSLDQPGVGQPPQPHASIPWGSVDGGLVFERGARWFGESLTQTLEPRLFYVHVPFRNQDPIPLFDTGLADFNYAQLFTENRFSGGDRFGDTEQVTLALTTRLLGAGGQEAFRATVGQRHYFRNERVGLTPATPLRTVDNSDLLASVGGRFARHWSFDTTVQYNPRQTRAERYSASVRFSPEIAKLVSASYRFNRDVLRQLDVSGQWPVGAGWYAVGRYNYSVRDKRLLEGLGGFEYNAGCWVFRAVLQRLQAAAQISATAFHFQLEFVGFGQVGAGDVVQLLKRNIPGYAVTNPGDPAFVPPSLQPQLPFQQVF